MSDAAPMTPAAPAAPALHESHDGLGSRTWLNSIIIWGTCFAGAYSLVLLGKMQPEHFTGFLEVVAGMVLFGYGGANIGQRFISAKSSTGSK
jgi:hypothetical protein